MNVETFNFKDGPSNVREGRGRLGSLKARRFGGEVGCC